MRTWNIYRYGSYLGTVKARAPKTAVNKARRKWGPGQYEARLRVWSEASKGRGNPARRVRKSTGWIKAKAVRIEKRGRQYVVKVKR